MQTKNSMEPTLDSKADNSIPSGIMASFAVVEAPHSLLLHKLIKDTPTKNVTRNQVCSFILTGEDMEAYCYIRQAIQVKCSVV